MKPVRFTIVQDICRFLPPIVSQQIRNFLYPINLARRDNFIFTVRSQTGSLLINNISDSQAYRFSIHGYHEWKNLAIAIALYSPGDTIIEIGAHIGTETIGFSDIVGPTGKVFAFEPLPSNLSSLKETLSNSQYHNVIVSPSALGEEMKKVKFIVPSPKESSGLAHIIGNNERPVSDAIEVDCITLDSLSHSISGAKVVFIDAEGADLLVLRGGKRYIIDYKPNIVLECHPSFLERFGASVQDLYLTIKSLGYEAFEISHLGLKRIRSGENYRKINNWFCVHSSKLNNAKIVHKCIKICGLLPCIPGLNPISRRPRPINYTK